jgi:hypothetical protein
MCRSVESALDGDGLRVVRGIGSLRLPVFVDQKTFLKGEKNARYIFVGIRDFVNGLASDGGAMEKFFE